MFQMRIFCALLCFSIIRVWINFTLFFYFPCQLFLQFWFWVLQWLPASEAAIYATLCCQINRNEGGIVQGVCASLQILKLVSGDSQISAKRTLSGQMKSNYVALFGGVVLQLYLYICFQVCTSFMPIKVHFSVMFVLKRCLLRWQ